MSFRDAPLAVIHGRDKTPCSPPRSAPRSMPMVAKYPPEWKQSAVMAALRIVQDCQRRLAEPRS